MADVTNLSSRAESSRETFQHGFDDPVAALAVKLVNLSDANPDLLINLISEQGASSMKPDLHVGFREPQALGGFLRICFFNNS